MKPNEETKMQKICKDLLSRDNWVVLDTETTGLDEYSEACQIGILSPSSEVLLDTLVKPRGHIPPNASRIHGITDETVKDAPLFRDLIPEISRLLTGKTIVVYNADFDRRILGQSSAMENILAVTSQKEARAWMDGLVFVDVMGPYAEHWGAWSDYHESYTWQKLVYACNQQGVEVAGEHSAIGDCKMTLALVRKIGGEARPDQQQADIKIELQSVFDQSRWQDTDLDTFRDRVAIDETDFIKCFNRLKNGECIPSLLGMFIFRMKQ